MLFGYLIFACASWYLLMIVYSYTNYYPTYTDAIYYIILYGALNGYLLYYFDFHSFFLWHIPIFIILLVRKFRNPKANIDYLDNPTELRKRINGFIYNSILYILSFSITYIFTYNDL